MRKLLGSISSRSSYTSGPVSNGCQSVPNAILRFQGTKNAWTNSGVPEPQHSTLVWSEYWIHLNSLRFHHHATLCIAAYGFLVAERSRFSPSAQVGNLGLPTPEPPAFLTGLNY
jgi:hypothetical protein